MSNKDLTGKQLPKEFAAPTENAREALCKKCSEMVIEMKNFFDNQDFTSIVESFFRIQHAHFSHPDNESSDQAKEDSFLFLQATKMIMELNKKYEEFNYLRKSLKDEENRQKE